MFISHDLLFAEALLEIRQLLSGYLGSTSDAPLDVRQAAHLAYALHNEALAVMEGTKSDFNHTLEMIEAIDSIVGGNLGASFSERLRNNI